MANGYKSFLDSPYAGEMPDAHGAGEAGDTGCGALIRIFIRFSGAEVSRASFEATGSSAAIAAASRLCERVTGSSWRAAASLAPAALVAGLEESGLNNSRTITAAAGFAVEALSRALEDSLRRGSFPDAGKTQTAVPPPRDALPVLVAMSGGVDSAVACLLEQRAGREVAGVTMRLWSDPECEAGENACCSPQAILDARAVCHRLGVPHLTVDFREDFKSIVVDDFVAGYRAGRTPNPCTHCNASFRFPLLLELARRLGAARVATGHYARMAGGGSVSGGARLARGLDREKDQSYMLWGISQELLGKIEFPLAEMSKEETRRLARGAGLPVHDRPESQEVCFIPDNDYRRFLRSRLRGRPGALPGAGDIVDISGNRLGPHRGYIDYTVGQRRGLGLSAPEPLYVLATDPENNRVVVGRHEELAVRRLRIVAVNAFMEPEQITAPMAQVRYNSEPVPCRLIAAGAREDGWEIELGRPVFGVAPGQSAVIYQGDQVAAGGVIAGTG